MKVYQEWIILQDLWKVISAICQDETYISAEGIIVDLGLGHKTVATVPLNYNTFLLLSIEGQNPRKGRTSSKVN